MPLKILGHLGLARCYALQLAQRYADSSATALYNSNYHTAMPVPPLVEMSKLTRQRTSNIPTFVLVHNIAFHHGITLTRRPRVPHIGPRT